MPAPTPTRIGLSSAEASAALARHGPNLLPQTGRRGFWRVLGSVLTEPMFLLLALAAGLYLLLGDLAEGVLLGAFAAATIGLVVAQQRRSERALAALRALGAPNAVVLRDGRVQRIAAAEVVPDDLLLVDEGERVAADGVLLDVRELAVDESLLTGESVPVRKRALAADEAADRAALPGGEHQAQIYAGSLVVSGEGLLRVTATGARTRSGAIGRALEVIDTEPTRLQRQTAHLVRLFGVLAALVSLGLLLFHGLTRGAWSEGLLSAIALAMAMLPEEFPLALSVFFALGAWRLAKLKVLARRSAVIETLGAATVLCVDKTGTLTENRMRVQLLDDGHARWRVGDGEAALTAPLQHLLEHALLATRRHTFDPIDRAVDTLAAGALEQSLRHREWRLERQYGLSAELPAMSQLWRDEHGRQRVASKGAPEAIASLCRLRDDQRDALLARVSALAADGLRVLAVAAGQGHGETAPADVRAFEFTLLGLIAFADPLRESVPQAIAQARAAGIAVKMITGDYPGTARAIARQAGLDSGAEAIVGSELAALDAPLLRARLAASNVFARIQPEQKLRIVEALKTRGEVVAMTGDGVNDAPALKAAHIGIAMGERGSDVAREAAGLVLLDENFARIVDAVRLGRRTFDNLRKVMLYIVAVHVPIAGLAMLPLLAGLPPLLLPAHVVLTEMIIDPMCTIAFENEDAEPGLMQRPPRALSEPLIGSVHLLLGLAQGAVLLLACLGVYAFALRAAADAEGARTLAFLALTAGNLMLVRANASHHAGATTSRRGYWWIALAAGGAVALCIGVPGLRDLFGFTPPAPAAAAAAIALGVCGGAALLPFKRLARVRAWLSGHPR
ncbi:MAG: cation-translocating P-type ATPase [Xanthomonadales bacterium]|nr:cation-translocating P-type ATPase [Xanthomonadales bacterium]